MHMGMSLEGRMKLNNPSATESTTNTAYYTVNIDHHSKKLAEPISSYAEVTIPLNLR